MILYRSATSTILQFCKLSSSSSKFISQFKRPCSFHSNPSSSFSSSSSTSLQIRFFCLTKPRRRQVRAFATATATATEHRNGSDTFYAEDGVSWTSLGVSDRLSQALCNAGFGQPSLVQVPSILSLLNFLQILYF